MFPSKAVYIWRETNNFHHVLLVGNWLNLAKFQHIEAFELVPEESEHNPLFMVQGGKTV